MSYGRLLSGSKCRLGAAPKSAVVARPDLVVLGDVVAVGRQRQARAGGRARDVITVAPVAGVSYLVQRIVLTRQVHHETPVVLVHRAFQRGFCVAGQVVGHAESRRDD